MLRLQVHTHTHTHTHTQSHTHSLTHTHTLSLFVSLSLSLSHTHTHTQVPEESNDHINRHRTTELSSKESSSTNQRTRGARLIFSAAEAGTNVFFLFLNLFSHGARLTFFPLQWQVPIQKYTVSHTRYPIRGISYAVSHTRYPIRGISYAVSHTRYLSLTQE